MGAGGSTRCQFRTDTRPLSWPWTGSRSGGGRLAARASLAARVDVIDALHLSGAEDRFIATLFQRRFFMLGLKAGTAGARIAVLVSLLVSSGGSSADMAFFLPRWSTNPFELIMLGVAPCWRGNIRPLGPARRQHGSARSLVVLVHGTARYFLAVFSHRVQCCQQNQWG